jgi:hypothetical protein
MGEYKVKLGRGDIVGRQISPYSLFEELAKEMQDFHDKQQKHWKVFERQERKSGHFAAEKFKESKDLFDEVSSRSSRSLFSPLGTTFFNFSV